jgi:hypothetical protein
MHVNNRSEGEGLYKLVSRPTEPMAHLLHSSLLL